MRGIEMESVFQWNCIKIKGILQMRLDSERIMKDIDVCAW